MKDTIIMQEQKKKSLSHRV